MILVTGSEGMMGWGFKKEFTNLKLTNKNTLDVTRKSSFVTDKSIGMIFHLAAETDHHRAEKNPSTTFNINVNGTENVIEYAERMKIPLIHVSTVGMFDGKKKSYTEEDAPYPLNQYAYTKAVAEDVVRKYSKHWIVRAGWGMGGGPDTDKKFINKIYQQIKSGTKQIYAINDVYGSPTYTLDFARAIQEIIKQPYGTYNVAPPDSCSRYQLAREFIRLLGAKVTLKSVSKKKYHYMFPQDVEYQSREVADTTKIQNLGIKMRPWEEALKDYVEYFK